MRERERERERERCYLLFYALIVVIFYDVIVILSHILIGDNTIVFLYVYTGGDVSMS